MLVPTGGGPRFSTTKCQVRCPVGSGLPSPTLERKPKIAGDVQSASVGHCTCCGAQCAPRRSKVLAAGSAFHPAEVEEMNRQPQVHPFRHHKDTWRSKATPLLPPGPLGVREMSTPPHQAAQDSGGPVRARACLLLLFLKETQGPFPVREESSFPAPWPPRSASVDSASLDVAVSVSALSRLRTPGVDAPPRGRSGLHLRERLHGHRPGTEPDVAELHSPPAPLPISCVSFSS